MSEVLPAPARRKVASNPQSQVEQKNTQQENTSEQTDFATELLIFEGEVRAIEDERELIAHLCNSSRKVVPYRQCFYGTVKGKSKRFALLAMSSVAVVDKNVPFNLWIEKIVSRLLQDKHSNRQLSFSLPSYCDEYDEEKDNYPFFEFLWTPQTQNDQVVGGVLMTRETEWADNECSLASRMSELYLHSQAALKGRPALVKRKPSIKPVLLGFGALALAAGFIPVSVTALAPVEVLPKDPFVLAAPFGGVVQRIEANQGQKVSPGDPLIVFDDVDLSNEKRLADQRAAIAQARYQRASQGAIADHRVKREIEVARAEYELAKAESAYASELLEQAVVTSPVAGIAIFSDKRDWEGKPVPAGQAIVSVADPQNVELSIDLPVKDSIVLNDGARIKVFLDSDPMNPLEAVLTDASYRAQPDKQDILAYTLKATLSDESADNLPRIGVQGTAQVFSEKASLAYVVFRRPISAFRQYTGW